MQYNLFSAPRFFIFAFCLVFALTTNLSAQFFNPFADFDSAVINNINVSKVANFSNPLVRSANGGCASENLRTERFTFEMNLSDRVRLCQSLNKITDKLNQTAWSPALSAELKSIWQTFSNENVTVRPMPSNMSSQILAMAQPFPDRTRADIFAAAIYVRTEKSGDEAFFQLLLHELRHVLDFHETWTNKTSLPSLEVERRAYVLMGKITRETPEKESYSNVPKFWKESWRKLSEEQISQKREASVQKFLRSRKLYSGMNGDASRQTLDFSYLQTTTLVPSNLQSFAPSSSKQTFSRNYVKTSDEKMPLHKLLPQTASVLPQNVHENSFNLEKPKNPRDPKEILRVALSNEKKLYYGMSNFVYDQKLAFQCLKEGKISASFSENHTVARSSNGDALFNLNVAPSALPCILNYENLKTDFTDTFWASPALEKMPIYFMGFYEVEGKMLAHYSVMQPDAKLFNQLAAEYPQIKPFRVVVGTIYVSPEDGQIVRFAGTSFPEETVTGEYAKKVRCTYWVKAVRQKLNIDNGLWVTVHVGSVAMASVKGKIQPFNYTVKFENYRQSETDVKIIEDETAAIDTSKADFQAK